MSAVLFWDIDGTLLTTARAGVFALEEAAREVLGQKVDFEDLSTAGLTDSEIAETVIRSCGREPTLELLGELLRSYERHLPERLHWRKGEVLPGVREILEDLRGRPDATCLLLTGNTREGARAKLTHYGLIDYFEGGAFCADGDDRLGIARHALQVASELSGREVDPSEAVVIGDTPHDVRCGQAVGARTLAVATGPRYTIGELEECDAWVVLPELPEPGAFRRLLGLGD
jgi:phosphoglycolate phosphatase